MKTLQERCLAVMPPVAARETALGISDGSGCYVTTDDGRRLLDFASGAAVNNLGHNHPKVVDAAIKQIGALVHGGHNVAYYEPYVTLAEKLVELTGGDTMVYFSNSGAEANDGAVKLAKYVTKRQAIIAFKNAFHGRTIGCTALTASSAKHRKYYDCVSGVYFAEYANCYRCPFGKTKGRCAPECLKQFDDIFRSFVDPECVAAIMLEPVQGEGGYIVPPKAFLEGIRSICDKHGILLIYDEVQTGFGRTGNLYAYQTFGVRPDILTSAKGIANGFPLSAIIAKAEIMRQWPAGAHGGTFGGNPVACAASLATIKVLTEEGVLENGRRMGEYLLGQLLHLQTKYPKVIGEVRGLGLMIGIELLDLHGNPNPDLTQTILAEALKRDLLLLSCGSNKNVVRFIAPLIVTEKEIDYAVEALDDILSK
ncbi:MAG: aspartate aminotransferase family protein [Clostridiales Family XIII bacterium]|jgi:4-aminobutyrate aminotransferase|nr:aspartate aminotransferase family protein [Clostridiales Family XIII bacterium]